MRRVLVALSLLSCPALAQSAETRTSVAGSLDLKEQSSAPSARTNYGRLYTKISDGHVYYKDDAGNEYDLTTGGASAAAILTALLTVDGAGSLLDADLLDGVSGDGYCLVDGTRVFTGNVSFEGATADDFETTFAITDPTADNTITFKDASGTVAFTSDITNMSAADILAALLTVDGSGSGIDADTLDGNNVLTDAQVVDTLTCSSYLPLAGGTMTGGVVHSGVTDDIAAATGEDLTLRCGGTTGSAGKCIFNAAAWETQFPGNVFAKGIVSTGASFQTGFLGEYRGNAGTSAVRAANEIALGMVDGTTTTLIAAYGSGALGIVTQQAITISTGDDTTSPTSSQVELACTTAPCTWKPGETSVVDGWQIRACNVDAADNIAVASNAGTVVVTGTPVTLTPGECIACTYSGAIWGCR